MQIDSFFSKNHSKTKNTAYFLKQTREAAFVLLLFAALLLSGSARGQNLDIRIPLYLEKATVKESLLAVAKQSKIRFSLPDEHLKKTTKKVNLNNHAISVNDALQRILHNTGLTYRLLNNFIIIETASPVQTSVAHTQPQPRLGKISGKIVSEYQEELADAAIRTLNNGNQIVHSDEAGNYSLSLPPGIYMLEVGCISFQTQQISNVVVKANETTPLNITMMAELNTVNQVVVTTTYGQATARSLYNRQKNMASLSDGTSADLIKKTGDNNVGEVLSRIAGVMTEKGNKFVNIRGLGDRYNNMQLNGSSLPSTEANSKNFSFDVIPSNLIDNIVVNKTFTPDLSAEFVGGLVNVTTLAIPQRSFFDVNMGSGFNTQSLNRDFYSGKRYEADWFLGNMKDRIWYGTRFDPDQYQLINQELYHDKGITPEREKALLNLRNEMGAAVPNTFGLYRFKSAPILNFALSGGQSIALADGSTIGYILSGTYRNEQNIQHLEEAHFRKYGERSYEGKKYEFATWIGALGNIGWQKDGHKITWSNLYNNKFANESNRRLVQTSIPALVLEQFNAPLQNSLLQTKLDGTHILGEKEIKLSWMADYNKVNRLSPDERVITVALMHEERKDPEAKSPDAVNSLFPVYSADGSYIADGSTWGYISQGDAFGSGYLRHSGYNENKKNAALNLEYPMVWMKQKQVLKAGYYGTFREGNYEQLSLRPETRGVNPELHKGMTVEAFFAAENFRKGIIVYNPYFGRSVTTSRIRDYYAGKQQIHAGYIHGEFSFFQKIRLMGGVRLEANNTAVRTNSTGTSAEEYIFSDTVLYNQNMRFFPSATAVYSFFSDFNLRAAFSKTIVRPDFNEITGLAYFDVYERSMVWNAKLEDTDIQNFDARLEWYPAPGEVLSFGLFYKKFIRPVEMMSRDRDGGNYDFKRLNLIDAETKGIEFNMRKSLGFIRPQSFWQDLYLSGNLTLLKGKTNYDMEKLEQENPSFKGTPDEFRNRPLQGMAPILYNAAINYHGERYGAAINFGHVGRRAVVTGVKAYLDEYENGRSILDLQFSAKFLQNKMELRLNATDLLNQPIVRYINSGYTEGDGVDGSDDLSYNKGKDRPRSVYRRGSGFSFGISYKF